MNEETEELDDNLINIKGDVYELTGGKVSIMENPEKYKSTYQVLQEISKVWDDLSDKNQAQLLDKLFGKTRAQIGASIISNFSQAEKAMQTMSESAGAADREMDIITNSLEYKINNLKETFTGIWQNVFNREDLGALVDFGSGIASVLDGITEKVGMFGSFLAGATAFTAIKDIFASLKDLAIGNGLTGVLGAFNTQLAQTGSLVAAVGAGLSSFITAHPFLVATAAAVTLYTIIDKIYESAAEANQKMESSFDAYDDAKTKVSEVNEELAKTKEAMDVLSEKKMLTPIEEADLEKLKQQTEYLQIQADLAEREELRAAKQAAKDTVNAYNKNIGGSFETWAGEASYYGIKDIYSQEGLKQLTDYVTENNIPVAYGNDGDIISGIIVYEQELKKLGDTKKAVDEILSKESKGVELTGDEKNTIEMYESHKEYLDSVKGSLFDQIGLLNDYKNNLLSVPTELLDSEQKSILGKIDQELELAYKMLAPEKWEQISFDKIFDSGKFKQAKQELIDLATSSENIGITDSDAEKVVDKYKGLSDELKNAGLSISDVIKHVESEAELVNEDVLTEHIKEDAQNAKEALSDEMSDGEVEPEVEVDPKVTVTNDETEKDKFNEWVDGLSLTYKEALRALQVEGDVDTSNWNVDDYQSYLDGIVNGTSQAAEEVKQFTGDLSDTSLIFSDNSTFNKSLKTYIGNLDTLESALNKVKSGEFTMSDLLDLQTQFADLNNYDLSNIGEGLDKTISGIFGHESEGYESLVDFKDNVVDINRDLQHSLEDVQNIGKDTFLKLSGDSLAENAEGKLGGFKRSVDTILDYASKSGLVDLGNAESVKSFTDSIYDSGLVNGTFNAEMQKSVGILGLFENLIEEVGADTEMGKALATWRDNFIELHTSAEEAKKSASQMVTEYEAGLSKVQGILKDQGAGKSISASDYVSDDLKDYTSALEYHNGVLQYNAEKVAEISKAKAEETKQTLAAEKAMKQADYLENARQIAQARAELATATDEERAKIEETISSLLSENSEIATTCNQYDLMTASINEATSAYQNWLNAQSATQSGDMFDSSLKAMQKIKDTLTNTESDDYGRVGNADYKAALDFIIPDTVDKDDQDAVTSYMDSIKEYLTFDDKGNADGLNIDKFCQNAVEAGLMEFDEASEEYKIAGEKTMQDFADGLGLSLPLVQAIFGEMEEFGGKFSWADEVSQTFGDLAVEANEAAEALRGIEGNEDLKIVLDVSDFESKETAIQTLDDTISEMNELKAKPDIDTSEIENANSIIQYCVAQKQLLEAPAVMSVDTSQVTGELGNALSLLQQFHEAQNTQEMQQELGLDTSEAESKVQELASQIQGLSSDTLGSLGIDATSVETITSSLQSLSEEQIISLGVDSSLVDSYLADDKQGKGTVIWGNNASEVEAYASAEKTGNGIVHWTNDESSVKTEFTATGTVHWTNTQAPTGGVQTANGTAHARGTALVGGNWGTASGGKTLVGELGREIVVDPRTGRWYTVGDNGAQFVDIPRNAIVFNHLQSESLLENGYAIGRGVAHAMGTALVTGRIKRTPQIAQSYSSTSLGLEDDPLPDEPELEAESESKSESASSKFSDWLSSLFDWAEVRLKRLNRLTEKWTDKAENAVRYSYNSVTSDKTIDRQYEKQTKYLQKALKATANEIEGQQKAKNTYSEQLTKIKQKSNLDNATIAKIINQTKNGTFDIEEYAKGSGKKNETLEAIKAYQSYYEKVMACKDAVDELKESQLDLYEKLYNAPIEKANAKIEKYEKSISRLKSISSATQGGSKIYLQQVYSDAQEFVSEADKDVSASIEKQTDARTEVNTIKRKIKKAKNKNTKKSLKKQLKQARSDLKNAKTDTKNARQRQRDAQKRANEVQNIRERYINAPDYEYQNYLLDDEITQQEKINDSAQEAYRRTTINLDKAQKEKDASKNKVDKKASSIQKKYGKNLSKSQRKALKNGKTVSTKGIKDKKTKNVIKDYNKDVKASRKATIGLTAAEQAEAEASQNAAEKQAELAEAIQETAKAKFDNVQTYYENIQSGISANISTIQKQLSMFAATGVSQIGSEQRNALSAELAKNQELLSSQQSELSALEKAFNENKGNMSNADIVAAQEEMENLRGSIYDTTSEIANLKTELSNIDVTRLSIQLDKVKANADKMNDELDIKSEKGISATVQDYERLTENASEQIDLLEQQNDLYRQQQEGLDENSEKYLDLQEKINDNDSSVRSLTKSQISYNNAIAQIPFDALEKTLELVQAIAEYNSSVLDIKSAKGIDLTEGDYLLQMEDDAKSINLYEQEMQEAYKNWQLAIADTEGVYGGKTAEEWETEYHKYATEINRAKKSQVELNNAIGQIPMDKLEKCVDLMQTIASYNQSEIEIKTTIAGEITEGDYLKQIYDAQNTIEAIDNQRALVWQRYQEAMNSEDGTDGFGNKAEDLHKTWLELGTTMNGVIKQTHEWRNEIVKLPIEKIQKYITLLESIADYNKSFQTIKQTRGMMLAEADYYSTMRDNSASIAEYERLAAENLANYQRAKKSGGSYGGVLADEWYQGYIEAKTAVNNLTNSQEELNNAIAALPYDRINQYLNLLDAIAENNKSAAELKSAQGLDLSESDYRRQMQDIENQVAQNRALASQAYSDYLTAMASPDNVYGGKSADEYLQMYNEYSSSINELQTDIEELKKTMRDDVFWRAFERAHQEAKQLETVLKGIDDLITDDMMFSENGLLSEYGASHVANLVKEFENARTEVQNFTDDITNLTRLYNQGYYSQDEFNNKLEELQSNLFNSASDMKGYLESLKSMFKDVDKKELDTLYKIIDKRSEALKRKKAYYEYDKTLRSKTKDIQELQAEIAALAGIEDAASKTKLAKLKAQLSEAQEDLENAEKEHYFELAQDSLDDLKSTLQDEFDQKWDDLGYTLENMTELLERANILAESSAASSAQAINELLQFYGINNVSAGVDKVYASGTKRVPSSLVGLSNESGSELLVTKNGIISHFNPGDGVVPAQLTSKLYELAKNVDPSLFRKSMPNFSDMKLNSTTEISQHYDALINIEGSADAATVEDLKHFSKDILEKSYEYTSKKINKDRVRTGGLRNV